MPPIALALIVIFGGAAVADAAWSPHYGPNLGTPLLNRAAVPVMPEVLAPEASLEAFAPAIGIIFPPPPPPPPPSRPGTGPKPAKGTVTYTAYCDAHYGPISGATSVYGLLAAANAERAQFGFGSLSWSDSLASLAQGWSDQLASGAVAWGHNPGRPGGVGENLASIYYSAGISESTAVSKAHFGWMATSAPHCKNLLNPNWTSMGAAAAVTADGTEYFITVNFS